MTVAQRNTAILEAAGVRLSHPSGDEEHDDPRPSVADPGGDPPPMAPPVPPDDPGDNPEPMWEPDPAESRLEVLLVTATGEDDPGGDPPPPAPPPPPARVSV